MAHPSRVYERLRGVNYVVATTQGRDNVQALLRPDHSVTSRVPLLPYPVSGRPPPFGQFDPMVVRWELAVLAALGFDSIRFYAPFTAWLVDEAAYLQSVRFIADTCARSGMGITVVIWGGNILQENQHLLNLGLSQSPPIPLEQTIKEHSDLVHLGVIGNRHVPVQGTYYQLGPWGDVDSRLLSRPGGPPRWSSVYPFLDAEAERRHPRSIRFGTGSTATPGLAGAVEGYLTQLGTLLHGHAAFLSYDLLNEPDLRHFPIGPVTDLIVYTQQTLSRVHPNAAFTIGVDRVADLLPLYQAVGRRGAPMTYASFHDYSDRLYTDRGNYYARLAAVRQSLGMPLVCSEFYSPFFNPPDNDFTHPQGRLGGMLHRLHEARIGGQIWAVLETNAVTLRFPDYQGPTLRQPSTVSPIDGLIAPVDPPEGLPWPPSRPFRFVPNARQGAWFQRDVLDLLAWTRR